MIVRDWLDNYGKYNLEIAVTERKGNNPERLQKLKDEKSSLEMALELLPDEDKTIIIHHYIEKKSYEKVAKELGYVKSTIFEKTKRIIKTLEELLDT